MSSDEDGDSLEERMTYSEVHMMKIKIMALTICLKNKSVVTISHLLCLQTALRDDEEEQQRRRRRGQEDIVPSRDIIIVNYANVSVANFLTPSSSGKQGKKRRRRRDRIKGLLILLR